MSMGTTVPKGALQAAADNSTAPALKRPKKLALPNNRVRDSEIRFIKSYPAGLTQKPSFEAGTLARRRASRLPGEISNCQMICLFCFLAPAHDDQAQKSDR